MKQEIQCAVQFLTGIVRRGTDGDVADLFNEKLCVILAERYKDHWHPENPTKGSAYRCIRNNHRLDPLVIEAAEAAKLTNIHQILPKELTLWIDPDEVSYRIGENGSICPVALQKEKKKNTLQEKPRPVSPPVVVQRATSPQVSPYKPMSPASSFNSDRVFGDRTVSPPMVMRKRPPTSPVSSPKVRKNIFRAGNQSSTRPRPVISSIYSSRLVSSVVS